MMPFISPRLRKPAGIALAGAAFAAAWLMRGPLWWVSALSPAGAPAGTRPAPDQREPGGQRAGALASA
jgi:hypothetical protein